jgi:hypothetical protein
MLWVVHGAERNPFQSADLLESGNQIGFVTILLNSPIFRRLGRKIVPQGVRHKLKKTWAQTPLMLLQFFSRNRLVGGDEVIVCAALG